MTETSGQWTAPLGDVDPAGSRHQGRRSAVALTEEAVVVGTADGRVRAFDRTTGTAQWHTSDSPDASIVTAVTHDGNIVVGERGPQGSVRVYDGDGSLRWRYDTAADVGTPQKDTRFFLPFVVDAVSAEGRLYVASRRYERRGDRPDGKRRHFESVVYAFEGSGEVAWRYRTDASPIALDCDGERLAVAYNRCPGDHQDGLVVLTAADGSACLRWDPGTEGQRRIGDVSLVEDGVVCTCHGDYRGYRLDADGTVEWAVDLAVPRDIDGETVYAYPNHVHATEEGVVFVTGNTYPEDGREAEALHPVEHTAFGYTSDGNRRWKASVDGFASGIATDGVAVAVPCAQNFRRRDAGAHGCHRCHVRDGHADTLDTEGIATAAAIADGTLALVEEPVVYHDDGTERGAYRLRVE